MGVIRDAARQPGVLIRRTNLRPLTPGGKAQGIVCRIAPRLACRIYCRRDEWVIFCCERCAPR